MEIMGNLGIHFSMKERNVVGVALFLLVSLTGETRVWSMHLAYSVIRRKCRTFLLAAVLWKYLLY